MLETFKILFLAFFDICRLVKKPQDIPESKNFLTLCLLCYALLSILLAGLSQPVEGAIVAGLLDVVLIMLFTYALLQINGKLPRWPQTVTALAGTGIIMSIIALPVYLMIGIGDVDELTLTSEQTMGLLLLAILACWNIVIMSHILKHALETHFAIAFFLTLTYVWIAFSFTSAVMSAGTS
ncbi:MAG: hypothetical protein ACPHLK_08050 [Gammaproteobacteria bacterium]|jgi:hypothetical protein